MTVTNARSTAPADAPRFDHLAIRASAGTGKTFQLTNRFIALLEAGESPGRILATTFSRKAAGEILDRVLSRIAGAALDAEACRDLAEHIEAKHLTPERATALLGHLARNLHRLHVRTLDSFFAAVAGSFALELALPPGWGIVDETDDHRLRAEAVRNLLDKHEPRKLVTLMRLIHRDHAARPVSQQLNSLVDDLYRIYIETPRDAWYALARRRPLPPDRLRTAVEELAAAGDSLPRNKNGSVAKSWVRAHRVAVVAARGGDWLGFINAGITKKIAAGEDSYDRKPIERPVLAAYEPLLDHARAVLVNRLADQTEAIHQLLEGFDAQYTRLKRLRHALRFEDVTRALAEGHVMGRLGEVYYRLDGRIAHLLLDEFQDTSPVQWAVLEPIAEEVAAHGDGERSLLCVGDGKQAIYGWRGGEAAIFDALGARLPGLRWEPLNRSYRSAPAIIDTVNRVFGSIAGNDALRNCPAAGAEWAKGFEPHTTAHTELPGYAAMEVAPSAEDEGVEAEVDQGLLTLRHAARRVKQLARAAPGRSIGILLRRKKHIARMIYELGRDEHDEDGGWLRGIRASEEGGNPLTDSPPVTIILSLLKLADHPGDSAARFHVATSPLGLVVTLTRAPDDPAARAEARRASFDTRATLLRDGYGRSVRRWAAHLAECCGPRDAMRLGQLVELAHRYDGDATLRPGDFVRLVESQRVEDPTTANVRVMTIHAAKGLQFDIVVLPELDTDLISRGVTAPVVVEKASEELIASRVCSYAEQPIVAALPELGPMFEQHKADQMREALCVLYVAVTRAVHALHMIVAPSKSNERQVPATFAGALRAALTGGGPLEPGDSPAFEHGDALWHEKLDPVGEPEPMEQEVPAVPILAPSGRRSRGLPRRSPSALEGGDRVDLARRMRLDTASLGHGSAIHTLFERVAWLDENAPDDDELRDALAGLAARGIDADEAVALFRRMLDQPVIADALKRSAYPAGTGVRLLREERFVTRLDDALFTGSFDRLVLTMDGDRPAAAHIIDFKTDRFDEARASTPGGAPDPGAVDRRVAFYRPQIDAYRRAAARLYNVDPADIGATLLFVTPAIARTM